MARVSRIIVTGGSGFLGSRVLELLAERGFSVVALTRNPHDEKLLIHPALSWVDAAADPKVFFTEPVTAIMHLATCYGRSYDTYADVVRTNVVLPLALLEAGIAQGVRIFVNADTFFTPELGLPPKEKSYITSKKFFLDTARSMIGTSAFSLLNFRIEQMYGPGDRSEKFIPSIIKQFRQESATVKLTAGEQCRDFVYVDDVALACVAALERVGAFDTYEEFGIGTGTSVSIRAAVEYLHRVMKSTVHLAWGTIPYREHEIMDSEADCSRNEKLGWKAKVSWQEGLQKTVDSF